jgi:ABC-2 type transport system ATP-binding protein
VFIAPVLYNETVSAAPAILCRNIAKRFRALTAVDGVTFSVASGEICTILGPNGAGKSTLIRMLCGLALPDSGDLSVCGHSPCVDRQAFRKRIGVVPENLGLLPELTVEEHLRMSGPIYGLDRRTTRRRSDEVLEFLGLSEGRKTYARECSHGMRKKTALAMALLHNPELLMLDEPFEGVDPASAETVRLLLLAAAGRGITVLLTSHILSLVDRISQHVLFLRQGRIVLDSPMKDLGHDTAEQAYFELVERPVFRDLEWLHSPRS